MIFNCALSTRFAFWQLMPCNKPIRGTLGSFGELAGGWWPRIDVDESGKDLRIKADLAGMDVHRELVSSNPCKNLFEIPKII